MTHKIKVLMVGPDPEARGGVATVAKNYIEGSLAQECDLRYVTSMVEGNKLSKLTTAISAYREFSNLLSDCDVVHLHMSKGASYVRKRLFARRAINVGVPYIIHLHTGELDTMYENARNKEKARIRGFFSNAARVIALSDEWKTYLAGNICPESKIEVLHNAVDIPINSCDFNSHGNVLFLGCLDTRKSPDVLLRASKIVLESYPDTTFIFAGDGDYKWYEQMAIEMGVGSQCEFLGWVSGESKEDLFSRSQIYCLPSRAEGMPMGLLEAMAHGIPSIGTKVGGIPSVIHDQDNGFLMDVDDYETLASIICQLLSTPSLRSQIGTAARQTVIENFSMDAHVDKLLSIYDASRLGG